jgi:hypothetical protein
MTIDCYAQRLLNPYRGTMQVVRYAAAEAVTLDGVHWDIYVANDSLLEGLAPTARAQVSDIRYGSWSEARGLRRGPLYPSEDFRRMEAMGAVVYGHLRQVHDKLPFQLRDSYEYWLLDADERPLALLHSAMDEIGALAQPLPIWTPGLAARERFESSFGSAGRPASEQLADYINGLAGTIPRACWYRRNAGGAGQALADSEAANLASNDFPVLCLRATGHAPEFAGLVDDYLAWQAAWLLCLPGLTPVQRRRLETHARNQADLVASLHRLYPEVLDAGAINAARVEARLSNSRAAALDVPDPESTFYIELNPQGGGYT